jgi:hypothetical protein
MATMTFQDGGSFAYNLTGKQVVFPTYAVKMLGSLIFIGSI